MWPQGISLRGDGGRCTSGNPHRNVRGTVDAWLLTIAVPSFCVFGPQTCPGQATEEEAAVADCQSSEGVPVTLSGSGLRPGVLPAWGRPGGLLSLSQHLLLLPVPGLREVVCRQGGASTCGTPASPGAQHLVSETTQVAAGDIAPRTGCQDEVHPVWGVRAVEPSWLDQDSPRQTAWSAILTTPNGAGRSAGRWRRAVPFHKGRTGAREVLGPRLCGLLSPLVTLRGSRPQVTRRWSGRLTGRLGPWDRWSSRAGIGSIRLLHSILSHCCF